MYWSGNGKGGHFCPLGKLHPLSGLGVIAAPQFFWVPVRFLGIPLIVCFTFLFIFVHRSRLSALVRFVFFNFQNIVDGQLIQKT